VVFATQGSDELFRDIPANIDDPFWEKHVTATLQPDVFVTNDDRHGRSDIQLYDLMGLSPTVFENLRLYVPCGDNQWWGYRTPANSAGLGTAEIHGFQWNLPQIAAYLPLFALTDSDDQLKALDVEVLQTLQSGYWVEQSGAPQHLTINSLTELETFFDDAAKNAGSAQEWHGHRAETIARAQSHYRSLFQRMAQVMSLGQVADDQSLPIDELRDGMVWVIDLSRLKDEAKQLALYKLLTELHEGMQSHRLPLDRLLIDIDELNQYSPRNPRLASTRLITAKLRNMAERAQTDGLVLLTAQEKLSDVDERVSARVTTHFYSMMASQEARQPVYDFSEMERWQVGQLKLGEMFVEHPMLRHRVKVRVPRSPGVRGQAVRALVPPGLTADLIARVQQLLAEKEDGLILGLDDIRHEVEVGLSSGCSVKELEDAARQAAQSAPLEEGRRTAQAILNYWQELLLKLLDKRDWQHHPGPDREAATN
jgi:hypothetical protein